MNFRMLELVFYDYFKISLLGRQQRAAVDGILSEPRPIVSGVLQGNVLGPLLFLVLVHTSDMVVGLENKIAQHVDDATLVGVILSSLMRYEAALSLSCDMKQISDCCSRWGMRLNSCKTKTPSIGRSRTDFPLHPPLQVDGTLLNKSDASNILGVIFDSHLTSVKHRKCRQMPHIFTADKITATCFRLFVPPLLEYYSPAWMFLFFLILAVLTWPIDG